MPPESSAHDSPMLEDELVDAADDAADDADEDPGPHLLLICFS